MARYLWDDLFKEDEMSGTQSKDGKEEKFRQFF
jgi:hypothetical protein